MNLTDEELFVTQLAITIAMDIFNRIQGRAGLPQATMESLILTFGTINTHTSIGLDLSTKVYRWAAEHPGVQAKLAAKLRDAEGGSSLIDLDGKPLL